MGDWVTHSADSILTFWRVITNTNDKFKNYNDLFLYSKWDQQEMEKIVSQITRAKFRLGKIQKRVDKYLLETEVKRFSERVKTKDSASIRFGNFKSEKASDFCLIGGCYYTSWKRFYLYYRSVELTFEFVFDMIMLTNLFKEVGITPKEIVIYFPRAFCSSRAKRLINFHKLKEIIHG